MLDVRRILVPIDMSECSRNALDYAVGLADRMGASLLVLHVLEPSFGPPGIEDVIVHLPEGKATLGEFVRSRAATELDTLLARLRMGRSTDVSGCLELGDPVEAILQAAERGHYDLIVMGTHGRRGLSRLLAGSVAEQVIRRANVPVLTLRQPDPPATGHALPVDDARIAGAIPAM